MTLEEECREFLLSHFAEVPNGHPTGHFQLDGKFYSPRFGCDALDSILDQMVLFVRQKQAEAWEEGRNAKHRVDWDRSVAVIEPTNPYKEKP